MSKIDKALNAADDVLDIVDMMKDEEKVVKELSVTQQVLSELAKDKELLIAAKFVITDAKNKLEETNNDLEKREASLCQLVKNYSGIIDDLKNVSVPVKFADEDKKFMKKCYVIYIANMKKLFEIHEKQMNFLLDGHIERVNRILAEERKEIRNFNDGFYVRGRFAWLWLICTIISVGVVIMVIFGKGFLLFDL